MALIGFSVFVKQLDHCYLCALFMCCDVIFCALKPSPCRFYSQRNLQIYSAAESNLIAFLVAPDDGLRSAAAVVLLREQVQQEDREGAGRCLARQATDRHPDLSLLLVVCVVSCCLSTNDDSPMHNMPRLKPPPSQFQQFWRSNGPSHKCYMVVRMYGPTLVGIAPSGFEADLAHLRPFSWP